MAFTAKDVQALREKTGVGMMDCKKALVETDGDIDKAIDILREKGLASAAKKASRVAAEGVVAAYNDANAGALVRQCYISRQSYIAVRYLRQYGSTASSGYRGNCSNPRQLQA